MGRGRIAASFVVAVLAALTLAPAAGASGCDPLDPSACLLPWPNDYFTRPDRGTPTGAGWTSRRRGCRATRRASRSRPRLRTRRRLQPRRGARDPVPGLDSDAGLARTGAVPVTDLARYRDERAPIVVIDAQTGAAIRSGPRSTNAATSDGP